MWVAGGDAGASLDMGVFPHGNACMLRMRREWLRGRKCGRPVKDEGWKEENDGDPCLGY